MQYMVGNVQLVWVAILVAAVMMMRAGLIKRALVARQRVSPCPSCGRQRQGAVCSWCTRQ
jgi:hypothetical protein